MIAAFSRTNVQLIGQKLHISPSNDDISVGKHPYISNIRSIVHTLICVEDLGLLYAIIEHVE